MVVCWQSNLWHNNPLEYLRLLQKSTSVHTAHYSADVTANSLTSRSIRRAGHVMQACVALGIKVCRPAYVSLARIVTDWVLKHLQRKCLVNLPLYDQFECFEWFNIHSSLTFLPALLSSLLLCLPAKNWLNLLFLFYSGFYFQLNRTMRAKVKACSEA